ncbi:MAG TPA: OmcA/MtrC family decaheme c-type cytochrome [Anaeromyxobacteraceae bacterium]|nr:OmcA/MtrC family decaheme c-type cytochrome [Anaeromyxobacteraceae bacterium]
MTFAADNTPIATIKFTDAAGKPLDFLAELAAGTFGARGPRYTIARLEADGTYKSPYESSSHSASSYPASVSGESAAQTLARVAAMYTKVGDGVYKFKWPAPLAAAPTATATYTVGTWASRSYAGIGYPESATFDFVPAGGTPTNREVVSDAACNACHKNLQAHGSRRTVKLCATCHYPGWKDATTGAVIDWRVMVHQIHGSDAAAGSSGMRGMGGTYPGFEHVVFAPRDNEVAKCESCHQGAMAANWKNPVAAACYSCHRNPAAFTPSHAGFGDAACVLCHGPTAQLPVETVHALTWDEASNTVEFTPMNIDVAIKSVDATNAAAVKATFTIKVDGAPYDLKNGNPPVPALNRIASLRLVAGGPVGPDTDFAGPGTPNVAGGNPLASGYGYVQSPALTTPANLTEVAVGEYTVTFPALPAASVGTTIAVGAEGYAGEEDIVEWAINRPEIVYAKVGGGEPTPRRAIADDAKCNACHLNLGFHGGNGRKGVVYCSVCHNSKNVNDERVSRFEVDPANPAQHWKVQPQSVWLPVMVHRLHRGGDLANLYTLGGNPGPSATNPAGSVHEFSGSFPQPGAMLNCLSCHKAGTFGLPGPAVQPMVVATYECLEDPGADLDNLCNGTNADTLPNWRATTKLVPPQQAICTSCHDDDATAAHVELNTTAGGLEACGACHGANRDWDAATVHVAPQ